MKRKAKILMAAVTMALAAGCASTGGGGGSGATTNGLRRTPAEALACLYTFGLLCPPPSHPTSTTSTSSSSSIGLNRSAASSQSVPVNSVPTVFESWSTLPRNSAREAPGLEIYVSYEGRVSAVHPTSDVLWADSGINYFSYDTQGNLVSFSPVVANPIAPLPNLSNIGHAGIDVGVDRILSNFPQSPFTSVSGSAVGVIGNPYALGWDYQSFGAWNNQASGGDGGVVFAQSFGAVTPTSAVPLSGTATFAGKLGGLYISPAGEGSIAAGDVTVSADFSARSLSFASSNTVTTRDLATATPAPSLNLSGMLSYSPGSGRFSGTLTSAGGTMSGSSNGQFYGPVAEELGGVFVVKSPTTVETFTGAYGAKR